jgi:hypothetical protein
MCCLGCCPDPGAAKRAAAAAAAAKRGARRSPGGAASGASSASGNGASVDEADAEAGALAAAAARGAPVSLAATAAAAAPRPLGQRAAAAVATLRGDLVEVLDPKVTDNTIYSLGSFALRGHPTGVLRRDATPHPPPPVPQWLLQHVEVYDLCSAASQGCWEYVKFKSGICNDIRRTSMLLDYPVDVRGNQPAASQGCWEYVKFGLPAALMSCLE